MCVCVSFKSIENSLTKLFFLLLDKITYSWIIYKCKRFFKFFFKFQKFMLNNLENLNLNKKLKLKWKYCFNHDGHALKFEVNCNNLSDWSL